MINGLWTINFQIPGQKRVLVLVFHDGKVQGGNTEYYYDGEYAINGNSISGNILAKHYNGSTDPAFRGAKEIELDFTGVVQGDLSGKATEITSGLSIPFTGMKRT